jgi:hypothetical protein
MKINKSFFVFPHHLLFSLFFLIAPPFFFLPFKHITAIQKTENHWNTVSPLFFNIDCLECSQKVLRSKPRHSVFTVDYATKLNSGCCGYVNENEGAVPSYHLNTPECETQWKAEGSISRLRNQRKFFSVIHGLSEIFILSFSVCYLLLPRNLHESEWCVTITQLQKP